MLRDYLIALSLSNLMFAQVWQIFLIRHSITYPYYHWKINPTSFLLATIFDVILLSIIFFVGITHARRSLKSFSFHLARWAFLVMFVLASINVLSIVLLNPGSAPAFSTLIHNPTLLVGWRGISTIYSWLMVLGLLAGCVAMTVMIHSLIYRRQRLIKVSVTLVLILSPFALLTLAQATSQWIRYRFGEQFMEPTAPVIGRANAQRRVLWLVFDEMDFRLGFVERPSTLHLPEFDRLREESVFASNAYPPSGDTGLSLPALITGRLVSRTKRTAPNELMLTFADGEQSTPWSTQPSVFSRARAMGLNTGLAGWYHPYCRVMGSTLTQCSWESASLLFLGSPGISNVLSFSEDLTILQSMLQVAASPLHVIRGNFARKEPDVLRGYAVQEFNSIHRHAIAMATNPNLDLVFVHYSIPHPPGIYDRRRSEFAFNAASGYLDNFALADRVLNQLRDKMEAAGIWKNTTVLISADHSLRAERVWKTHDFSHPPLTKEDPLVLNSITDERVPFIVKLAGETNGLAYEPAFNTVLSHDLLLAVLSGEVAKNEDVVDWLDRRRTIGESPYIDEDK